MTDISDYLILNLFDSQIASSEGVSTTNAIVWQNKLTLAARYLKKGYYKTSYSCEITGRFAGNEVEIQMKIAGVEVCFHRHYVHTDVIYITSSGFFVFDNTGPNPANVELNFRSVGGALVGIQRARLSVERLP